MLREKGRSEWVELQRLCFTRWKFSEIVSLNMENSLKENAA
ncbi:hypothetical protein RE6C_01169 [Rhodopirellula europaea 6C]|uniref:Uncharacterized protein n=1 Tax=Rhodopirellula europaea 6C TaxID=1263867 RepID=M2AZJ0_9BACT|nr:hypothetical protein RE6C_01169 [Rhodopirellula europaea 6C]